MVKSKERTAEIQAAARATLLASGWQLGEKVPYRTLAPALKKEADCSIDTAKRHLMKAGRILRGEAAVSWGGAREGAGRPHKEESLQTAAPTRQKEG